jgi:predicted enzyme related to lactoylglutathione lyase
MKKMNPVVHFEMPAENKKRMADFYTNAFGWQTQMLGEDIGGYVLATTAEPNEKGHPKNPGAINGGFYSQKMDGPAEHPSVVIAVDDIKAAMKDVEKAGGKVIGVPMEIPGFGMYVSFYDTEKNKVSMMQGFMKQ